jgi:hypothetical protein
MSQHPRIPRLDVPKPEKREAQDSTTHYGPCRGCGQWGKKVSRTRSLCSRCVPALQEKLERGRAYAPLAAEAGSPVAPAC